MHKKNNILIKIINELYNKFYILNKNIQIFNKKKKSEFSGGSPNMQESNDLENVWLLNLLRLYRTFVETHRSIDYNFLDVGCGNGIPIIYSYEKFTFKSYQGFDFIREHVDNTKRNITNYLIKNKLEDEIVKFNIFFADASYFKLDLNKYFIFMFNPFSSVILDNFIKNNILSLKKTNSVIAYSNYKYLQNILKYNPKNIIINERYKIALIEF